MSTSQSMHFPVVEWALARIAGWMAHNRRRRQYLRELNDLAPGDLSAIATDMGVGESHLRQLVVRGLDSPELLGEMRAAVGVSEHDVPADPRLLRDMQAVCSMCDSKRRCRRDVRAGRAAVTFREFCPNAPNLEWLSQRSRARSGGHATPVEAAHL